MHPATADNLNKFVFPTSLFALCLMSGVMITVLPNSIPLFIAFGFCLFFLGFSFSHLAILILVYAMLLSPEYVIGSAGGRNIVIRVDDFLIVIFSLAWMARMVVLRSRIFEATPLNRPIVAYCSIFILTTLRGMILGNVLPITGLFYILKYVEYFLIYFVVASMVKDRKQARSLLKAFFLTFLIVNIYAFSQMGLVGRVSAPFEGAQGEPNTLGGYQVLMLGIILGVLTHTQIKRWRWPLILVVIFSMIPFAFTLSRSSYVSFLPMYFTLIIFNKFRGRNVLLGVLIIAVILATFFFPQRVRERLEYTFIPQKQETIEPVEIGPITLGPSGSARIRSWIFAFEKWKQRPFLGYGITGLGFMDSQYVRNLAELGIAGFMAFLILLTAIFRNVLRIYKKTRDGLLKGLALGFLAGHIGMVIHAATANTFIITRIMEPYWFLLAMVMMIPKIDEKISEQSIVKQNVSGNYPRASMFLANSNKKAF